MKAVTAARGRVRRSLSLFILLALASAYKLHAQADTIAGGKTFAANCAGCHGSDGRGGERAPNIATARNVMSLTDAELSAFIRNGVTGAGMPSFSFLGDRGITDVVAYLRVLQGKTSEIKVTGDDHAGRALFFGSAGCSRCHMMHGEGGFIASDLSDYGSGIALERIRGAIIGPESTAPTGSEVVEVITVRGEQLRGVLRSEDNFIAVIQAEDGSYRRLAKAALKKFNRTGHSLMPAYKDTLSAKQLDDVIAYLVRSADPIDPATRRLRTGAAQ